MSYNSLDRLNHTIKHVSSAFSERWSEKRSQKIPALATLFISNFEPSVSMCNQAPGEKNVKDAQAEKSCSAIFRL
ncbi:hypothetical protein TNCT_600431 [Trichonephila clavata]|uniref:Uncharacterized protein n=1 Tax=Trichonephila clavata TaxID=2740835 RepID=A0A8X6GKL0_TRICU|nr:hypothetical protein TNCT_600431 [Trichonephila clavata]